MLGLYVDCCSYMFAVSVIRNDMSFFIPIYRISSIVTISISSGSVWEEPFTALYRLSVHSFLSGLPKMNENSRSLYFVLIMFYAPLYFVVSFSFY